MKITKAKLKQIIKVELRLNEADNTRPEKLLGDMHVRLSPIITKLNTVKRAVKGTNDELDDFLDELQQELRMYQQTTFKYKDLGDIR